MDIGIVGNGVVGSALFEAYKGDNNAMRVYDINPDKTLNSLHDVMEHSELIFVCLPTPQRKDKLGLDVSVVDGFFARMANQRERGWDKKNFVLKSTVPIGTTKEFAKLFNLPNLVHSPEFLTARTSVEDAKSPRINVVGSVGAPMTSERWLDHPLGRLFMDVYDGREVHFMSSDESEAVKLLMNSFFAVKVAFWNEARSLCDKLGVSYSTVLNAILQEGRVHPLHTQVPGPDGQFGFGGTCLPKDLSQFSEQLTSNGLMADISCAALLRNVYDRRRVV